MTLQIEEGKYYRRGDGRKVGPLRWVTSTWHTDGGYWADAGSLGGTYYRSGSYSGMHNDPRDILAEWADEPAKEALALLTDTPETETFGPLDIKTDILAEAGRIVNGARRSAYGTPENNFERIARFWQAYFENKGCAVINTKTEETVEITAADVSPMMRLMKEARLCETPDHYDSFVDIVGYTLTGAEVNKVKSPK